MTGQNLLAERFEANRRRLKAVAYRMLGSTSEAEDAVQEAWLRLSRSDDAAIENIGGWLTTVVARICLDMLRTRKAKREDTLEENDNASPPAEAVVLQPGDPEQEALLADSVGLALLVVLQTLQPAERVAFVLHDMFDIPFDDIAAIIGRTSQATRQLAARARRRVRDADKAPEVRREQNRRMIEAFLAASRSGDMTALLALLDPDIVVRADAFAGRGLGGASEVRGAETVAGLFKGRAQAARVALIDGEAGAVVAPHGRVMLAVRFRIESGRIVEISGIGDPAHLAAIDIADFD
jgi:RNA polymerase sigma-70 factor, ECF subfamily